MTKLPAKSDSREIQKEHTRVIRTRQGRRRIQINKGVKKTELQKRLGSVEKIRKDIKSRERGKIQLKIRPRKGLEDHSKKQKSIDIRDNDVYFELLRNYEKAVWKDKKQFNFQGTVLLTSFAKYYIEYIEERRKAYGTNLIFSANDNHAVNRGFVQKDPDYREFVIYQNHDGSFRLHVTDRLDFIVIQQDFDSYIKAMSFYRVLDT